MTITPQQVEAFFKSAFEGSDLQVAELGDGGATLRKPIDNTNLRPGGTVSGPTLFTLADAAIYAAIFGELGMVTLAVTTNLNINFLRKPAADKAIISKCQLIKVGKSLVVGEVSLYSEGEDAAVAHAVGTYSIPPENHK